MYSFDIQFYCVKRKEITTTPYGIKQRSVVFGHIYDQSFIYSPTDAPVSCLKSNIEIYIKTAPILFIHQLMHQ